MTVSRSNESSVVTLPKRSGGSGSGGDGFVTDLERRIAAVETESKKTFEAVVSLKEEIRVIQTKLDSTNQFLATKEDVANASTASQKSLNDHTKWIVGSILGSMIALAGLVFAIARSFQPSLHPAATVVAPAIPAQNQTPKAQESVTVTAPKP